MTSRAQKASRLAEHGSLLGGSGVVISMVISPLIWVIAIVTLLITPLKTTHEPPSTGSRDSESRKAEAQTQRSSMVG